MMSARQRNSFTFFTNTTYIILKQQSYNRALRNEANYNKVPKTRSKTATVEQVASELQQWHRGRMVAVVRKGLTKCRLEVAEDDVEGKHHRRPKDDVEAGVDEFEVN
jgi:hypothetical protein